MKNKQGLIITLAVLVILGLAAFFFIPDGSIKTVKKSNPKEDKLPKLPSDSGDDFYSSIYTDAPKPEQEEPRLESQVKNLWPHLAIQINWKEKKERVKKEWTEFSAKYPDNIYIPSSFKAPSTEEEKKQARKENDTFLSVFTGASLSELMARNAKPGELAKDPGAKAFKPEEQRAFFFYKQKELKSRIELVEYAMSFNKLLGDQAELAKKDLEVWKKELQQIEEISKTVPKT